MLEKDKTRRLTVSLKCYEPVIQTGMHFVFSPWLTEMFLIVITKIFCKCVTLDQIFIAPILY